MEFNSKNEPSFLKVLNFLKTHDTEYLSGQDLSDVLRISRVAIWKSIKKIEELGYKIETKQKVGYKLVEKPKTIFPWELSSGLKTKFMGHTIYYFDEIDSTQRFSHEIANKENNGAIIIATQQNSGKGRIGRKWVSRNGGIYFSAVLFPKFDISFATVFPMAASLALAKTIEKLCEIKPELKWPNDVTIKGEKVAGILVDVSLQSNKIDYLILGIGINFDINEKEVQKELKKTPNFYGVKSLGEFSKNIKPVKFLQTLLQEIETIYFQLESKEIEKITKEWTKRSSTIGKNIKIPTEEGIIQGKATRIENDGALVVENKNKSSRIIAGDVVHLEK
ncbi:MAG: biotin--[acetyl-CoA-carboxylase] ligase [Nitrosopumilus sp.]